MSQSLSLKDIKRVCGLLTWGESDNGYRLYLEGSTLYMSPGDPRRTQYPDAKDISESKLFGGKL